MSSQELNLSLDQHLPPHGRQFPTTSGGFLKYPSKIRSLREPLDITKTSNAAGMSTRLILDLGASSRVQSPGGEGRRVRESLEELKNPATVVAFDPTSSQIVQHFRNKAVKRGGPPSLIGGAGFSQVLQNRNLDALAYARMRRHDASVTTEPEFTKLDLSDLSEYQRWNKGECEPFLKELRTAILANRPENIAEFVAAWAMAVASGQEQPKAWLPGEREAFNATAAALSEANAEVGAAPPEKEV